MEKIAFDAEAVLRECREKEAQRAERLPTEQDCLEAIGQAYLRLKELGWNDAIYCPKDGSTFNVIEAGSTGIHKCVYHGEWPNGRWWICEAGDLWPSRPILFKKIEKS